MRKSKKLITGILACAMALCLSVPAFAAEIGTTKGTTNPDPDPDTKVTLTKTYSVLNSDTVAPAATFDFTLTGVEVAENDLEKPPVPNKTTYSVSFDSAGTKTFTIDLADLNITKVGVYTYEIKETVGKVAGVDYGSQTVKMKVTAVNSETTTGLDYYVALYRGEKKIKHEDAFKNIYKAGNLNVTKEVTGNLGDKSKYFKFTVKLTGDPEKIYSNPYTISGGSYTGNMPDSITVDGEVEIYLKDGDTISIANLPYGVEYNVTETTYKDYKTTVTDNIGSITKADQTAAFTNNKGHDVDTGITLDSLPYILILVGVIAVVGAVVVMKKRKIED